MTWIHPVGNSVESDPKVGESAASAGTPQGTVAGRVYLDRMGQHPSAVEQYLSGRTGTPIDVATLRSLAMRLGYIETTGEAAGQLHSLIPVYLQVADRIVSTIDAPIAQLERELRRN